MSQWDLLLTQNVHATLVEFSEVNVNIGKGALLSANASGVPTVLAAGTNTYMLVADSAEDSGLKWEAVGAGHTQNTDIGTDSVIFELDTDGFKVELTAESATKFGVKVDGGATYADLEAKDITANDITLTTGTVATAPSSGTDIVNKDYADALIAANDAMVYKGTVGSGGTIEQAALEALTTYNAGWTYRVITAGTIFGVVCEVGDLITCIVDRTGSGDVDSDWTVIQTNLDGAVIGPASANDGYFAIFDGTTGKLLKDGAGAPGTMAYETATDYVTKALFDANTILKADSDNTPAALTVPEQTLVGRITAGVITALTPAEVLTLLNVSSTDDVVLEADFDANTLLFATSDNTPVAVLGTEFSPKLWAEVPADMIGTGWTGTAIAGQIARDDNYFYVCKTGGTATNQAWIRTPLATNWN